MHGTKAKSKNEQLLSELKVLEAKQKRAKEAKANENMNPLIAKFMSQVDANRKAPSETSTSVGSTAMDRETAEETLRQLKGQLREAGKESRALRTNLAVGEERK